MNPVSSSDVHAAMSALHPDKVLHVRESWAILEAEAPQTPGLFYDHLFTADPSLIPMFGDNMSEQGDKLMEMLRFAVRDLENPERFEKTFRDLGRRHKRYGVLDAHYPLVGTALLIALAQVLGDRFTEPVRAAWATFYELITDVMLERPLVVGH